MIKNCFHQQIIYYKPPHCWYFHHPFCWCFHQQITMYGHLADYTFTNEMSARRQGFRNKSGKAAIVTVSVKQTLLFKPVCWCFHQQIIHYKPIVNFPLSFFTTILFTFAPSTGLGIPVGSKVEIGWIKDTKSSCRL